VVNILGPDDAVLARGEVAFDDAEVRSIAGKSTDELRPLFPGRKRLEVVHRDHLVVL
jgi:glutamate 5-kinase